MSRGGRRTARADKAVKVLAEGLGLVLIMAEPRFDELAEEGIRLKGFSVRFPDEERPDYQVIMRADGESDAIVGFGGGATLAEAIRSTLERIYNRSMKWKEDQYA